MNNELKSIEDIDAMLDSQFNIDENDKEDIEDTEEEVIEEETDNQEIDETEETEDDKDDESSEEEQKVDNKPTKEDKKEYAFSQLRKENAELKSKANESKYYEDAMNKIASQYGYTNAKDFMEAYENARMEQEAKNKGLDPVLYAELQKSNKRIAELEENNRNAELTQKATALRSCIDRFVDKYSLGEDGNKLILDRLEEEGFSIDSLLNVPNFDVVIKGVLSDKIEEASKQTQIEKNEAVDNLSEDRHDGTSSEKSITLDDLIANEMKQYKADNFYN